MDGTQQPGDSRLRRNALLIEGAFLVFWLALFLSDFIALLHGQADTYHNQHWRGATLAGGAAVCRLPVFIKRPRFQFALLGASAILMAVSFWLIL
jgi:hypothetical protein